MSGRAIGGLVAVAAALAIAGPAEAAPSAHDARAALRAADSALIKTTRAVREGRIGPSVTGIAETTRLERRAARVARRAASHRSPKARSKQLRLATGGVDRGFDAFAGLIADAPAELQDPLVDGLTELADLRAELVGRLTALMDDLSADQRGQLLEAIAAFEGDGDLDALLAALGDPDLSAALAAQLEDLLTSLSADLQGQIDALGGLEGLLPPGGLDQLDALLGEIGANLDDILAGLEGLIDEGTGTPTVPGDDCAELIALFEELGIEPPPGFCAD